MIPESRRSSVVLPEPLRPTRPTALPGSTANETSRSAHDLRAARVPAARRRASLSVAALARVDAEAAAQRARRRSRPASRRRRYRERPPHDPREHRARTPGRRSASRSARARARAPAPSPRASMSRSQRISRWSETNPTGQTSTSVDRRARAAPRGGRGCPARATARRSAIRSGTRTTSRRARRARRRAATSRAAGPCTGSPVVEDPRGQRVRGEDDVCVGSADAVGEQLDEAGLVVPAVDEGAARRGRRAPARAGRGSRRSRAPSSAARARARRSCPRRRRRAASAASAMRGVQCFMPVKTGTSPSSASSAARVSSVIAFSGEPSSMPRRR